jgi:putative ABC transport system permease protein
MEVDIAADLNLGLGDRVTWDVQGVLVETRITSLRRVNWARFEPNFFAVFQPGVLEQAPQMTVVLARVDDPMARARFQGDLIARFPNVAAVDLTLFQGTIDLVFSRVTLAIRFMALFSVAAGLLILVGALATSRLQRTREVVLLRTLGARTGQVRAVLFTEYAALGALAGLAGALLAGGGGWLAARFVFEVPFQNPVVPLAAFALGTALLTVLVGAGAGRALARRPPLEVLRELSE